LQCDMSSAQSAASGHLHTLPRRSIAVCFTPVSGIDLRNQALPSRANTGPEQVQQTVRLFDDLVGAGNERRRHGQAHRGGSLEIDDQLEFGCLLHRQVGRLGPFQNAVDVARGALE
jgi:hypothetical protein